MSEEERRAKGPSPSSGGAAPEPFVDRLERAVGERSSQLCLGLDPRPGQPGWPFDLGGDATGTDVAAAVAESVAERCEELIAETASSCVAVKLQLACFERLGTAGWAALERVIARSRGAGLIVIADGKRGDVPVSAEAYADALFSGAEVGGIRVGGLGADAATVSPMLGGDSLEPFIESARAAGGGIFVLVRTSNPGAQDVLDLPAPAAPLHERLAMLVAERAERLRGACGLSGLGGVVGATEPRHLDRLRELMPTSVLLLPGIGAQGGSVESLGAAFAGSPASALVTASRGIVGAAEPRAEAERLRELAWAVAGG